MNINGEKCHRISERIINGGSADVIVIDLKDRRRVKIVNKNLFVTRACGTHIKHIYTYQINNNIE